MSKKKIIWLSIILTIVVGGGFGYYYAFKRKPATAQDSKPDITVKAEELLKDFENNYKDADKKYLGADKKGENIGVNGKIKELTPENSSLIIDGGNSFEIICTFDENYFKTNSNKFEIGKEISIKGIYTGCEGFEEKKPDEEMSLIEEANPNEKSIKLKTCAINN
ncbi:MAG: hypothetical protein FGM46_04020 [Ferruginibacter sp.]|nr:hypothetical protein [Ferruginibacter sp.]